MDPEQLSLFDVRMHRARFEIVFEEIEKTNGNLSAAAVALGIHRNTLTRILKDSGKSKHSITLLIRERRKNALSSNSTWGSDVLHSVRPGVGSDGPRAAKMPKRESLLPVWSPAARNRA